MNVAKSATCANCGYPDEGYNKTTYVPLDQVLEKLEVAAELADRLEELAEDQRGYANTDHSPEGQRAHSAVADILEDLAAEATPPNSVRLEGEADCTYDALSIGGVFVDSVVESGEKYAITITPLGGDDE